MHESSAAASQVGVGQVRMDGTRLYPPWVLTLYSVVANVPMAVFLYGVNLHRRGQRVAGLVLKSIAGLGIALMTVSVGIGAYRLKGIHVMLLGIAVGLGLRQMELSHYKKSLLLGARPAAWWPPVLFIVCQLIAVFTISYFVPDSE